MIPPWLYFPKNPDHLQYFKQLFAQVTNPPIDPIREEIVTASVTFVGSEGNLTKPGPKSCRMIKFESPLIADSVIDQLSGSLPDGFDSTTLPILFHPDSEDSTGNDLKSSLDSLFEKADKAIEDGVNIIILSDRELSSDHAQSSALGLFRLAPSFDSAWNADKSLVRVHEPQKFSISCCSVMASTLSIPTFAPNGATHDQLRLSETPETACKIFWRTSMDDQDHVQDGDFNHRIVSWSSNL